MDKPDTYRMAQVTRFSQAEWEEAWLIWESSGLPDQHMEPGWTQVRNAVDRLGGGPVAWVRAIITTLAASDD